MSGADAPQNPNRRRFLKSVFGLGGAIEATAGEPAEAKPSVKGGDGALFFWADLKLGNIGFPSGLKVPHGRPGSVMKLVTAACLLEEGFFNPNEKEECGGSYDGKAVSFHCKEPHGAMTIEEALGVSCNVFFARAVRRVGSQSIIEYAKLFGLDQPVVGYKQGAFPTKLVHETSIYALGLADDLQPNALQLLRIAAAVAGGGTVPPLRNAGMLADPDKEFSIDISERTFDRLRKGMIRCVREGTANNLDPDDRMHVAAKTGTVAHGKTFESWVIGFFAHENPRHAFSLFAPVGTSHDSAVPQARKHLTSVEWPA